MKNAIIIHGRPSKDEYYKGTRPNQSNSHWLPWLQQQLLLKDILAQTPEMPRPFKPNYAAWKNVFESFQPSSETILVGHSYGAGFLVRWLTENPNKKVGKVILVAPSLGYGFEDRMEFFNFEIDPEMANHTQGITIVVAKNDRPTIQKAVKELIDTVKKVRLLELETGGHLTFGDMGTDEFPELLTECLK